MMSAQHPATTHRRAYLASKRVFDVVFAIALLGISSPIWIAASMLVALTSPGPVLYRQARVGENGRLFTCLKFRTMVCSAEDQKVSLLQRNEVIGPVFKIKRDPRTTRIGRLLRKSNVDELPQLLNVIRGDMSIVGPRPPLPEEVAQYTNYQLGRLAVIPGITCLWQVSGRNHIGFDRWVELDMAYIRRRSFWYDLRLILLTIPAVLTGHGAF